MIEDGEVLNASDFRGFIPFKLTLVTSAFLSPCQVLVAVSEPTAYIHFLL
jgi:hypothetical protein